MKAKFEKTFIMVTRILCVAVLLISYACNTQDSDHSAEATRTTNQQIQLADSLNRDDTLFVRLHSSVGQTIYVPVYSHIYQLNQQKTFNLTATLSIRNTDMNRPITLKKVLYYDSQGELVKNYLSDSLQITSLASTSFVVEENDLRGGVGANFIVEWSSKNDVYPPVVEAVMISTSQQQGISFVSTGRVLQEAEPINQP